MFSAVLPRRIATYHAAAMRYHDAPRVPIEDAAYAESCSKILKTFSGNIGAIPPEEWQPAFDALFKITSFDWDCNSEHDLGGFTMQEARRASVTLRLWSELLIRRADGISCARSNDLANVLARHSNVPVPAARAILEDITFDVRTPRGKPDHHPMLWLDDDLVSWSPTKVFLANHCRNLLCRLSIRDKKAHDAISEQKHRSLIEQVKHLVASHGGRLAFVSGVTLPDTDLDAVIVDRLTGLYLCLEAKAMRTPKTLREALDVDGRQRDGRMIDGLMKGSVNQVPKILNYAMCHPEEFRERVARASDVEVPSPTCVFGAVISSWTFGTGAADDLPAELPHQRSVRVITVPILSRLLTDEDGDLEAVFRSISRGNYLLGGDSTIPPQRVEYGGWLFEWHFK
jgi:hypothetical protein